MTTRRWPLLLAGGFLLLHAFLPGMLGTRAVAASFVFLVLAPLLAALAAAWRCRVAGFQPSRGWSLAALAMLLWALGMAASSRQHRSGPGRQRVPLHPLRRAADAENVFLCAGLLMRWFGAASRPERTFFGIAGLYAAVYLVGAGWNNHSSSLRGDTDLGTPFDLLVTIPFVVFATACLLAKQTGGPMTLPSPRRVHFVRSASPLAMALALLVVSLFLVRLNYGVGVAGILVAVLGYGLRTMLSEVRHIETEQGLREEQRSLEALALSDALTGVANRRAFDAAFAQEWHRAMRSRRPLSVLMIDIDQFKSLNDRQGHPAGDRCLRLVAGELRRLVKRPADLLARYGGEEFVALLAETDIDGSMRLAEHLRAAVQSLRIDNAGSLHEVVTVSIGAATGCPADDASAAALLQAADEALYEAKAQGRNRTAASRRGDA